LEETDLDRERMTVLVCRGKGKKDRVVPLGRRALAWLDTYLAAARPRLAGHAETPLLFVSKNGHRLHANQLSKIVRDYLRGAGINKPGAAHLFRNTTATLMLEAGADVRYIQALLGHSKLSTTAIYANVSIVKLREVHERTHPARLFRLPDAPRAPASEHPADDDDGDDLLWVPIACAAAGGAPAGSPQEIALHRVPVVTTITGSSLTCKTRFRAGARDAEDGCHLSAAASKPQTIPLRAPLCPLASHCNYTWARFLHAQLGAFVVTSAKRKSPTSCWV